MLKTRAKYYLGQVVRHRKHPFRGVVFDVDAMFTNTEENGTRPFQKRHAPPRTSRFTTCWPKTISPTT